MTRGPRCWLVATTLAMVALAACSPGDDHTGHTDAADHPSGSAADAGAAGSSSGGSAPGAHDHAVPAGADVDAGFAYDMGVHHQQAVEMAELVAGRATDPEVAVLGRDIALTQQYQVGEMRGWLDAWGLPPTTTDEPMAWMGMTGPMPGLASPDEIERLRTAAPGEVDRLFLELMIRHHEGGLAMAEVARDHARHPYVRQFAASIATSQTAEVDTMNAILGRLPAPG